MDLDTNKLLESYKSRIQRLLDEGETEFDLLKDFPAEKGMMKISSKKAAGYAMSFLFWQQVNDQSGAETIQKFIGQMSENGMAAADVQKTLKQISGKDFSTTMDLKRALSQLDKLFFQ